MNSISQLMKYRRSMVEYALKHGVTKTAIKYDTYRQYVYRWLRRYDGSLESLRNKSRRPKHHPKAHTAAELKLIQDHLAEDLLYALHMIAIGGTDKPVIGNIHQLP